MKKYLDSLKSVSIFGQEQQEQVTICWVNIDGTLSPPTQMTKWPLHFGAEKNPEEGLIYGLDGYELCAVPDSIERGIIQFRS